MLSEVRSNRQDPDDLPELIEAIVSYSEASTPEPGLAKLGCMKLGNRGTNI